MTFRESVQRAMQSRGINQSQLAALVGMRQQEISRWLLGVRELRTDRLERIAEVLKLELKGKR